MAFLTGLVALVSTKINLYPITFGTGVVVLMALNALAAMYPLYYFRGKKNPFNVYILGMIVRLGIVGMCLILVITLGGLEQAALLAITLTGMFSFMAFLAVEIHHFLQHNASFMSTAA